MPSSRTIAWLITLGAAGTFCVSIYPMATRIAAHNAAAKFPSIHAEAIYSRTINVEGFPQATLTDDPPANRAKGMSAVRLQVQGTEGSGGAKGSTLIIPVKQPPADNMPNLASYEEWLKVMATYEVARDESNVQRRRLGSERLTIVVRRTPEGYDPESWGKVRRDEWLFDFYDIKRDGSVDHTTRRWPRKSNYGDPEARLKREAAGEGVDAQRAETAKRLLQYEPLKERSPEFFIAMHVIPKLSVPEYKFTDTAFSPKVLGWTLPASMLSILAFCGGIIFALAPKSLSRKREEKSAQ